MTHLDVTEISWFIVHKVWIWWSIDKKQETKVFVCLINDLEYTTEFCDEDWDTCDDGLYELGQLDLDRDITGKPSVVNKIVNSKIITAFNGVVKEVTEMVISI